MIDDFSFLYDLKGEQLVELFEIQFTADKFGFNEVLRFCNWTAVDGNTVSFGGNLYTPIPVQTEGFNLTAGNESLPQPKVTFGNTDGAITALLNQYGPIEGARFVRRRTLAKYLDFAPNADSTAEMPADTYYIDRKEVENALLVSYVLVSPFEVDNLVLPRRIMLQGVCPWRYRGEECGYTGTAYYDFQDQPVAAEADDVCGKRLASCKLRFGESAALPFGGFPGLDLVK